MTVTTGFGATACVAAVDAQHESVVLLIPVSSPASDDASPARSFGSFDPADCPGRRLLVFECLLTTELIAAYCQQ